MSGLKNFISYYTFKDVIITCNGLINMVMYYNIKNIEYTIPCERLSTKYAEHTWGDIRGGQGNGNFLNMATAT